MGNCNLCNLCCLCCLCWCCCCCMMDHDGHVCAVSILLLLLLLSLLLSKTSAAGRRQTHEPCPPDTEMCPVMNCLVAGPGCGRGCLPRQDRPHHGRAGRHVSHADRYLQPAACRVRSRGHAAAVGAAAASFVITGFIPQQICAGTDTGSK